MAYRKQMPNKRSQKLFSKTADRTHSRNTDARPMRGGIRL